MIEIVVCLMPTLWRIDMPSFDIVSKIDFHEVTNAVDQANREVANRFDFKGSNTNFTLEKEKITLTAPTAFQLQQMIDILQSKLSRRNIDIRALDYHSAEESLHEAKQVVDVRQGIETDMAKKIVKLIKEMKTKVQASIQGEQVRVTGKKRDDLQAIIAELKEAKLDIPLQFENFRD